AAWGQGMESLVLVGLLSSFDALSTNFVFKLFPDWTHGLAPFFALLGGEVEHFGSAAINNGLFITLVVLGRVFVDFDCHLFHDFSKCVAYVVRQSIPELGVGDHHIVQHTVVGFGDVLLYLIHFL